MYNQSVVAPSQYGSGAYEPGAVVCFMGSLGSGKTLTMSLLSYCASMLGVPVYSNYSTSYALRISSLPHLFNLRSGLLVLDEMQALLDSREFKRNTNITQWLMLIRKFGLGLYYTSQHIDNVDKRLRLITDYIVWASKSYYNGSKCSVLNVYRVSGDSAIFRRRVTLQYAPSMFSLYDTLDYQVLLTMEGYESPFSFDTSVLSLPSPSDDIDSADGQASSAPALRVVGKSNHIRRR